MEVKDFLPIIGVAVGWSLSEIAGAIKSRASRAKAIKKSITTLYILNAEMTTIKNAQEAYKNLYGTDLAGWERGRVRSFQQYSNTSDEAIKKIDDSISVISEEYPIIAFNLTQAVKNYRDISVKDLSDFIMNKDTYFKFLNGLEVGQLGCQMIIETTVMRLAFKVDLILWLQLKFEIYKFKKSIDKRDITHFSQAFKK